MLCFIPPRLLQSGASFYRILSVASDAPVRGIRFTPGRSSPGASAVLHSAPVAPIRGVFLSYSLRCLGCSSPWLRFLPRTIQSRGWGCAPIRPGCCNPARLFNVFSPLPRMLQSGASFCPILSVASDAPVRGTGFTPGRSSPGASAVLQSTPVAPIRGVFLMYSLRCLGCSSRGTWFTPGRNSPGASAVLQSAPVAPIRGVYVPFSLHCLTRSSPWHRVHPRTIQSGG